MIIDSHCHLDDFYSRHDLLSTQLTEFKSLSPSLLSMSVSSSGWLHNLQLSQLLPQVHSALGIHPWYIESIDPGDLPLLESLLRNESVAAIGEIGLDFSTRYKHTGSDQIELLNSQLILALQYDKPVSLHVIKAHNEMLASLSNYPVGGVVHGLGSSCQIAQHYIDYGLKIGVNAVLLRDNARRYHELVRRFGLKHLVLETDFPNVYCPHKHEAELSDIILVANKVAKLLNVSLDSVMQATSHNANSIFQLNGL
ncbi:MAG: TatD DNase family protein [Thiomicrorhabdus sp.]|nr:MAG: TatD DNase family protein [Thiomicrorhabdus sp.]